MAAKTETTLSPKKHPHPSEAVALAGIGRETVMRAFNERVGISKRSRIKATLLQSWLGFRIACGYGDTQCFTSMQEQLFVSAPQSIRGKRRLPLVKPRPTRTKLGYDQHCTPKFAAEIATT